MLDHGNGAMAHRHGPAWISLPRGGGCACLGVWTTRPATSTPGHPAPPPLPPRPPGEPRIQPGVPGVDSKSPRLNLGTVPCAWLCPVTLLGQIFKPGGVMHTQRAPGSRRGTLSPARGTFGRRGVN